MVHWRLGGYDLQTSRDRTGRTSRARNLPLVRSRTFSEVSSRTGLRLLSRDPSKDHGLLLRATSASTNHTFRTRRGFGFRFLGLLPLMLFRGESL
ncbi:hypothetical protein Bca52824_001148 [Brassica carinata]|uniref:Uncharacterized protein n=1 Tax=Brassica carinata TaxID=52824 RepID=A0A8X7WKY6_BRACI|nr:hypothetical protein Bca52824_001148 [Brassica carinata]